ncbi:hypothetical protein DKX38_001880 [Salix brachista]|uniref:Orn/DAP/Arg decarboxylase 2 C-terminal domain-containing protein n=1 Tax=Salix brachista TaxID=2182728 RepID=A0A5N5NM27_9ROSI|nr:hypothetical protein DKX38_001880 [Salix brachista]
MIHLADPPQISSWMGYKQWYLASLNEELPMVARYRKVIPDFEYKTDRFDVDELDANGTNWLKLENLADQILDYAWEGHDFGFFYLEDDSVQSLESIRSWTSQFRNNCPSITCTPLACNSNSDNPVCKGERSYSSTVFGPTCDGLDTVLMGHQLPELQVDDWLVFLNMGAY